MSNELSCVQMLAIANMKIICRIKSIMHKCVVTFYARTDELCKTIILFDLKEYSVILTTSSYDMNQKI